MTDYEYIIKQAKKLYYTQWSEEELRKCVDILPALEREELVSLCHCKWIKKVMKEDFAISEYCIVDDDSDMLDTQMSNFVQTNTWKGITENDYIKIKQILKI